jgi:hypothetical protein
MIFLISSSTSKNKKVAGFRTENLCMLEEIIIERVFTLYGPKGNPNFHTDVKKRVTSSSIVSRFFMRSFIRSLFVSNSMS